jgi:hypothetical protein
MNSQPNSHTHCQAAQAKAQTKAWQRVCLSHPAKIELKKSSLNSKNKKYATPQTATTMTVKRIIDNGLQVRLTNTTGYNRRLAKKRVPWLIEALCFVSSSVLADSFVLRNPLLRQAPKRCAQPFDDLYTLI